jgi:hypothetical protein
LEATFAEYRIAAETASAVPLEHMRVAVVDDADTQIHDHFDRAIQFIDAALAVGGKVIVHCKVAAHLLTHSLTHSPAIFVVTARPIQKCHYVGRLVCSTKGDERGSGVLSFKALSAEG